MVHSGRHVVRMVTSCFRRCYNRRRGYEPIPRCEAEKEKGESGKAQKELCEEEEEEDGCKKLELYEKVHVWENLQEEGESHEACGDRLLARFKSRGGASFAAYRDLHYAAYFYAAAGSWRKAALTYGELADYCRKTGRELSVGSALLRSAKCYAEVEEKTLEEVVATKVALDEALALFVKKNDRWLAATACSELGEFHMQHNELHSALVSYQRAAEYLGTWYPSSARCATYLADHVRSLLENEEALLANGDLPFDNYKRISTGYMKPTDPDWRRRLYGGIIAATSIAHQRYYLRGLENRLYESSLTPIAPAASL